MINDVKNSIDWVGNHLGSNISYYGKGEISGLIGMILNVHHPFLFTGSVLHNGIYDYLDPKSMHHDAEYFFRIER
jgi:hypothetical protein